MNITTVGLDLAKNVFHVICLYEHNKEVKKRILPTPEFCTAQL